MSVLRFQRCGEPTCHCDFQAASSIVPVTETKAENFDFGQDPVQEVIAKSCEVPPGTDGPPIPTMEDPVADILSSTQEADLTPYGKISSFVVDVLVTPAMKLGAKIASGIHGDRGKLCITHVRRDGALAEWNRKHPGMEVDSNCVVLEINGVVVINLNDEDIKHELCKTGRLKLYVKRMERVEYRPRQKQLYEL
mmetsp:Transcript_6270/g.13774  ORF Transcript_6270/g.13774 Transcript_6270/m.13774 type:complete len:194 (+) Transcript_6270:129-710(+)